jgi:hypothetical protein
MAALVAAPTAKKIKTVLAIAIAAAANHGLDLLSGCCPLGSLDLREASIPFSCLSYAIICDLRRRMSSIRRSSLISITVGLLAVIGVSRWCGQVRVIVEVEARTCPLRQLQERATFPYLPVTSMSRYALGRCDRCHKFPFEYPLFFGRRVIDALPCAAGRHIHRR